MVDISINEESIAAPCIKEIKHHSYRRGFHFFSIDEKKRNKEKSRPVNLLLKN